MCTFGRATTKKPGRRIHEGPVVIVGAGGLGLMVVRVPRAMGGVGAVTVARHPDHRDAAPAASALQAVDLHDGNVDDKILAVTAGGARAVLDLVGAPETIELAVKTVPRRGHSVACGLIDGAVSLLLPSLVPRPFRLEGSYVGTIAELRKRVALVTSEKLALIPISLRSLAGLNTALRGLAEGRVAGRVVLEP